MKIAGLLLTLFLIFPAYFVMLYWLLSATDAPAYVWGVYWAYIPSSIFVGILNQIDND